MPTGNEKKQMTSFFVLEVEMGEELLCGEGRRTCGNPPIGTEKAKDEHKQGCAFPHLQFCLMSMHPSDKAYLRSGNWAEPRRTQKGRMGVRRKGNKTSRYSTLNTITVKNGAFGREDAGFLCVSP